MMFDLKGFCDHALFQLLDPVFIGKLTVDGRYIEGFGRDYPRRLFEVHHFDEVVKNFSWEAFCHSQEEAQLLIEQTLFKARLRELPEAEGYLLALVDATPKNDQELIGLGLLAGQLAHEIRTPLQVLKERLSLLPHNSPQLDRLIALSEHMIQIVRGLRDLARGHLQQDLVKLDLRLPVDQALNLIQSRLQSQHIHVIIDQHAPVFVMGGPSALAQIFLNLFSNAADAMSDCPVRELLIVIKSSHGLGQVRVYDTGAGVSPEIKDRLMRPYQTTKGQDGTGLGLHISQQLLQRMRGKLTYIETSGGACFEMTLPMSEP